MNERATRNLYLYEVVDIVVSRTVRDLLLGSSHRFEDLGRCTLKGVDGEWELYRLDEGAR